MQEVNSFAEVSESSHPSMSYYFEWIGLAGTHSGTDSATNRTFCEQYALRHSGRRTLESPAEIVACGDPILKIVGRKKLFWACRAGTSVNYLYP